MITYFKNLESGEEIETGFETSKEIVETYIDHILGGYPHYRLDEEYYIDEEIIIDDDGRLCTELTFYVIVTDENGNDLEPKETVFYWYNQRYKFKYSIYTTDEFSASQYLYKQDFIYTDFQHLDDIVDEIVEKEFEDVEFIKEGFCDNNKYYYLIKHNDIYENIVMTRN